MRVVIASLLVSGIGALVQCPNSGGVRPLRAAVKQQQQQRYFQQRTTTPTRGLVVRGAEEQTVTAGGFNTAGEPPFEIRGISLAKAFLAGGTFLTTASFAEYFGSNGQAGLSSLGFIYGIPVLLIGFALQYAELEPVPIEYVGGDEEKCEEIWEAQATETLKKIRQDVTRHRYGDEAHLDTTVKALGLVPPGKPYPQLKYLQINAENSNLSFAMVFQSPETPFNDWADDKRVAKYNTFFGPGVTASVSKVDADKRLVAIQLVVSPDSSAPATAEAAASASA